MWVRVRLRRGRGKGNSTPEEERGRSGESCPYCRPTVWAPPATWMATAFIKLPLCSLDLKTVESPLGRASLGEKLRE